MQRKYWLPLILETVHRGSESLSLALGCWVRLHPSSPCLGSRLSFSGRKAWIHCLGKSATASGFPVLPVKMRQFLAASLGSLGNREEYEMCVHFLRKKSQGMPWEKHSYWLTVSTLISPARHGTHFLPCISFPSTFHCGLERPKARPCFRKWSGAASSSYHNLLPPGHGLPLSDIPTGPGQHWRHWVP